MYNGVGVRRGARMKNILDQHFEDCLRLINKAIERACSKHGVTIYDIKYKRNSLTCKWIGLNTCFYYLDDKSIVRVETDTTTGEVKCFEI